MTESVPRHFCLGYDVAALQAAGEFANHELHLIENSGGFSKGELKGDSDEFTGEIA